MTQEPRVVPVILSGGSGTRLWPASRPERPKQFLALAGDHTMLQQTAERVAGTRYAAPIVVAAQRHGDLVEEQLAQIGVQPAALVLEPVGRNTAPAIALAALAAGGDDTLLLVMPSDHLIKDEAAFQIAVDAAIPAAADGWLCTFGIAADRPETGFGWIKAGEAIGSGVHRVDRFVEKPALAVAEDMLRTGGFAWNGGIFLFRADRFLDALAIHAPAILSAIHDAMEGAGRSGVRVRPDADAFAASPSDSIDYAVMEKDDRVAVVPASMGWSDVGSWDAIHAIGRPDVDGNVLRGTAVVQNASQCLIYGDPGKRVALVGVRDLIVVVSGDDVLIMPRGQSQQVKNVVDALKG